MSKRTQPLWSQPSRDESSPKLMLYNSLTRTKCEFTPINGNTIKWYNCGPTVYDSSHMGHARSYISFDIIRRILKNYFNYDIFYIQNVTDIDDKVIRRARQNHLFEAYRNAITLERIIADVRLAIDTKRKTYDIETDGDKKIMMHKMMVNAEESINTKDCLSVENILEKSKDLICDYLDRQNGHEVNDNSIFVSLPRHYENEFNDDMKQLNVLPPDAVTRVLEYIPEIIDYINVIINNGYAYESKGSIYFDTDHFNENEKHFYAKLVPEAFGDSVALDSGEGDLTNCDGKRSANDFALWKCSKPGEPWWDSPWGRGRPGWHIECSVMAHSLLGPHIDIHSGGYDLKFPHHDNEIAQSEAYSDTGKPWVNYFIHSGHLTIEGCKMSKSLKNFITIKEVLKGNSARQLRIAFLLHAWKDTLDYSDNTMAEAVKYEKTVNEFILTVKDMIRQESQCTGINHVKWDNPEITLNTRYHNAISTVHASLCDNIDTRSACEEICRLISSSNSYIQNALKSGKIPNVTLIRNIAFYITEMFRIFGADFDDVSIGFGTQRNSECGNREENVMPFLEIIAQMRENVRTKAKELKNSDLLTVCDEIRDRILPNHGVRMEDLELGDGTTKTVLKLVDRQILMKEMEEKVKNEEKKRIEKERKRLELEKLKQQRESQKRVIPSEMFLHETDKYSLFDDKGIPTHDAEGKELSKGQIKKLQKLYQTQEKKYNDYLKENGDATNGYD